MKNVSKAILNLLKQKINSRCQKDKKREDAEQKPLSMTPCFNKGFTLIELLVVVLIIGILSAVALPQYQVAVLKSRTTQGMITLNAIDKAQEEYKLANGDYTTDLENLSVQFEPGSVYCSTGSDGSGFYCQLHIYDCLYVERHLREAQAGTEIRCFVCPSNTAANNVCKSFGGDFIGNHYSYNYYTMP